MYADGELLRRILQNLIDNAVRHGPAGGTVRLMARRADDDGVEIRVVDEGTGIPVEMRQSIFEKYTRIEGRPDARDATGRGLGLAFCRLAVQAQGGRISVEENEPRGSVFTVWLPGERRPPDDTDRENSAR